jgi:predicted ABC-type ATPase
LVFFWLSSEDLAIERVNQRVKEGGHFVAAETIRRRYFSGLAHFFSVYASVVDQWLFFDNNTVTAQLLAESNSTKGIVILNPKFDHIRSKYVDGFR